MLLVMAYLLSMPAHVGDRWVYEVTVLSHNRNHPDIEKWRQQITTVAIQAVAEGTLIKREVELLDHTRPTCSAAKWSPASNILIHNNCLYYLDGGQQWDREALADVCMPLQNKAAWGDSGGLRNHWTVAGRGRKYPDDPASITAQSWRLESHLASGDDNYVWFAESAGCGT